MLADTSPDLRRQLPTSSVAAFALAGNATLTVVSRATKRRMTLNIKRLPIEGSLDVFEVYLLCGPNNERDFKPVGTYSRDAGYRPLRSDNGRRLIRTWTAQAGIAWFFEMLHKPRLAQAEVWHEGRCGRCGRRLTVPSSIESGFGPECVSRNLIDNLGE